MCHHYNKVVDGAYMFAHDEKLKLKVCLEVTKSKLETHLQKQIHRNTFGNTFAETHSNF